MKLKTVGCICFFSNTFSHYTSVQIFIVGDNVYFGKYGGMSILAWGKGRNEEDSGADKGIMNPRRTMWL